MKKLIVPLFLIIGLGVFSCKKDVTTAPTANKVDTSYVHHSYYQVSAETKKYAVFKPGTYWIYKEYTSGHIDSVYVTRLDSGAIIEQKASCQWFDVKMHNSYAGQNTVLASHIHHPIIWQVSPMAPGQGFTYYIDSTMRINYYLDTVSNTPLYEYMALPAYIGPGYYNSIAIEDTTWVYSIGPTQLNSVIQLSDNDSRRLLSKNYGLLKRTALSNSTILNQGEWNLIRCHIVQ